jgi:hypothetical protein
VEATPGSTPASPTACLASLPSSPCLLLEWYSIWVIFYMHAIMTIPPPDYSFAAVFFLVSLLLSSSMCSVNASERSVTRWNPASSITCARVCPFRSMVSVIHCVESERDTQVVNQEDGTVDHPFGPLLGGSKPFFGPRV